MTHEFDDFDERIENPGRRVWDLHSVYELFGFNDRLPKDASGEVDYQGVKVILRTADETDRSKSKAMGRIIVKCGCGKTLSFGRMEQHAKACEYARGTLYLTPRIPPIETLMQFINANGAEFTEEEVLDFIDYCREAWMSIPKDPNLQNAMRAEWRDISVTLNWVMSEFEIQMTRDYDWVPRFRAFLHDGTILGTWNTNLQAENAVYSYIASHEIVDEAIAPRIINITDTYGRVGLEPHIYGLAAHPNSDDSLELVATGQWELTKGDGMWMYVGMYPPWRRVVAGAPRTSNPTLKKRDKIAYLGDHTVKERAAESAILDSDVQENIIIAGPFGKGIAQIFGFHSNTHVLYFLIDPANRPELADKIRKGDKMPIFPNYRPYHAPGTIDQFWASDRKFTNKLAGACQYVPYEDEKILLITHMSVKAAWRRQGLNTLMINAISQEYPDYEIVFDDPTSDGKKFHKSFGRGKLGERG